MKWIPDDCKEAPEPSPPFKPPPSPLPAEGIEPQPIKSPQQAKVSVNLPLRVSIGFIG